MGIKDSLNAVFRKKDDSDYFIRYLRTQFDAETADEVIVMIRKLLLPLPQDGKELLAGREGGLIFSNDYGVVIRIEHREPQLMGDLLRVNDNPWVLRPLGSFAAGTAVIEICPGCHSAKSEAQAEQVEEYLKKTGLAYWDCGMHNTGLLPFQTVLFPDGMPIVIDRLAVSKLEAGLKDIKAALAAARLDNDPQETLYKELYTSLLNACPSGSNTPDPQKMKDFWQLCRQKTNEGLLIAGWNEDRDDPFKLKEARRSASTYDQRLKAVRLG